MSKSRLEAFSDGVIAIIITIMVLELKIPHGAEWEALRPLLPVFLGYVLSFIFVGIYWNNHHHLFQVVKVVNGPTLWANLHLLFWLSLVPFVTSWMSENEYAALPVALYGVVLLMAGVAYYILVRVLIACNGKDSLLAKAIGDDKKGVISLVIYTAAILLTYVNPWFSCAFYVVVLILWLIPDPRMERVLTENLAGSSE